MQRAKYESVKEKYFPNSNSDGDRKMVERMGCKSGGHS